MEQIATMSPSSALAETDTPGRPIEWLESVSDDWVTVTIEKEDPS